MNAEKISHFLIAEDDPDDRVLLEEAVLEANLPVELTFVDDGQELMNYLEDLNGKAEKQVDVIVLDLNMPRMDGREALREIKASPELGTIPLVVFTTSNSAEDTRYSYENGASSFLTKPASFTDIVDMVEEIYKTWG